MSIRDVAGMADSAGLSGRLRSLFEQAGTVWRGSDELSRAKRGAMFAFAIRVAGAGLVYLSQALLARWMGSFEYGIFVFVTVWVMILGGLAPLGLSATVIRFIPEYQETRCNFLVYHFPQ